MRLLLITRKASAFTSVSRRPELTAIYWYIPLAIVDTCNGRQLQMLSNAGIVYLPMSSRNYSIDDQIAMWKRDFNDVEPRGDRR